MNLPAEQQLPYAAAHTAWKYGIDAVTEAGRVLLRSDDREALWPSRSPLVHEIDHLLRSPLPKMHTAGTAETSLDDAEDRLLADLGFSNLQVRGSQRPRVWLTHDIDQLRKSYQVVSHALKSLARLDVREAAGEFQSWLRKRVRGEDPYWNVEEMLEIEAEYGVPSTFFFLNQKPIGRPWTLSTFSNHYGLYDLEDPEVVSLMRNLCERGFEIGVHGSYETPGNEQMLREEMDLLGRLLGDEITLSRHHYLNYEPWDTAAEHERVGLRLDSSMGFTRTWGFRTRSVHPMLPPHSTEQRPVRVLQVPPTLMDKCVPEHGWQVAIDRLLDSVTARGGVFTAIWHNTAFARGAPRRYAEAYRYLIEQAIARNAQFITGSDLLLMAPDNSPPQNVTQ